MIIKSSYPPRKNQSKVNQEEIKLENIKEEPDGNNG